jgi:hypothetical protein
MCTGSRGRGVSARDELEAAFALVRGAEPRVDPARAPAVAALRGARMRVAVDAAAAELHWALVEWFPATARVLTAVKGGARGWLEEYLRSPELESRPPSTRFATLRQLVDTFPAFARRVTAGAPAPLAALFDDALASELCINELRQPDPRLAAVMHRLAGPFAAPGDLLKPADIAGLAERVALASHARLGVYGRDVAALQASARSRLAGFLSPLEWVEGLGRDPALAARPGRYHAAHVLRPSGQVATVQLAERSHAALSAGSCSTRDPAASDDLLRLAAAGALRPAPKVLPA